ncbi:hypothetical protein [Methanoregula sp.]|uniref:hypothetical protein n=1 Tax=Methanoregula sp. TaxID=2052170 RepID=UPI0026143137|nr:hypothetical protein [Methanoregula sp.]MDD5144296.1 hypothetical protein [Methanoregula sp.]
MTIAVCYPDKYSVEETFQLLKVPWEWYKPGKTYDVVIARKEDVIGYNGPLIDITDHDPFRIIACLLNCGEEHLHEPVCDIELDFIRQELKKYTLLVEIPPAPWGHPYMVALTHDVDVTSVRECRWSTVGYAAYQCLKQGHIYSGLRFFAARLGLGTDPWKLFERWQAFEQDLGVRSTFFFVPKQSEPGRCAPPYRAVFYTPDAEVLKCLVRSGWETGVHGLDNWIDMDSGKMEMEVLGIAGVGNRTHWLLFEPYSWKLLDNAGYTYDSTFGYNDDVGFRGGTLQVFRPRTTSLLLELPLHIQDIGLFTKSCWAPDDSGWKKKPCLHLNMDGAADYCARIFEFAKKYGGEVTLLWHYESIAPPRDWSEFYRMLVERARADDAWLTTAEKVVTWFRTRRQMEVVCTYDGDVLVAEVKGSAIPDAGPNFRLRLYIPPEQIRSVDAEFISGQGYIDICLTKSRIMVHIV